MTRARRRILPMGERALLIEVDGLEEALALDAVLAREPLPGIEEIVPAARTLLLRFDPDRTSAVRVRAWVADADVADRTAIPDGAEVALDVVYAGPDLRSTADLLRVTPDALVARHSAVTWQVAFTGFAPGFGYLVSEDWRHEVPRLDVPRERVPEGSVGLAGGFTGAYPRATPGGWRLIGTTTAVLFDPAVAPEGSGRRGPVLLTPGTRVRMRPVPARIEVPAGKGAAPPAPGGIRNAGAAASAAGVGGLRIERAGAATVQDLGRGAVARLGVARSGAVDRASLRLANRLVGNPEDAAAVEIALGGFAARAGRDLWVAVAGAWGPMRVDGRLIDTGVAFPVRAGDLLELDWFTHGARAVLSVRGGIDVAEAVGARSTDTLAGLGPPPLRAGDVLAVGDDVAGPVPIGEIAPWGWPADPLEIELAPGPRADWFTTAAHRALFDAVWTVGTAADRVGLRLEGPALARAREGELPSEGMVPGALQVPPGGRPTVLLADGPVTGGYPVIAVATDAALDRLAQARPGTLLRFRKAPG
ncbi:urea amidolyase family protein [Microbacterium caowuchunii]|uniref:5-oxoprolinase subunit B/C family protein n=1 Tax=Microbacterium caowuchunii TaxID=2614638 RepID=UPI001EE9152D|nr:urea amidolyase family protein [Microbacterium caowuchunii]